MIFSVVREGHSRPDRIANFDPRTTPEILALAGPGISLLNRSVPVRSLQEANVELKYVSVVPALPLPVPPAHVSPRSILDFKRPRILAENKIFGCDSQLISARREIKKLDDVFKLISRRRMENFVREHLKVFMRVRSAKCSRKHAFGIIVRRICRPSNSQIAFVGCERSGHIIVRPPPFPDLLPARRNWNFTCLVAAVVHSFRLWPGVAIARNQRPDTNDREHAHGSND